MAPGIYGADIEQLRALSKSMGQSRQRLQNVESTVNSLVQSAAWKGADGDEFRNAWTSSLRPLLSKTTESLEHQSKSLLMQAAQQEKASNEGGSATSSTGGTLTTASTLASSTAEGRNWDDAFTDPNYEHAPSGVEWLLEKWLADGSKTSDIVSALQLVADKFNWNLELAQVEKGVSRFFDGMKYVGKGLTAMGIGFGILDVLSGYENRDPFRFADGVVGGGLALAAGMAALTGVGLPLAAAIGGAGLLWGLASIASGDIPVTKRIWDFGSGLVGGVQDIATGTVSGVKNLADRAGDALSRVGGKLGFG
ncbi:WXG100 family type VII secretion target [Arthrobacter globiformis]|uniref:WXG100 family type VII secretion target n=1 Tax=Arthrobacter globiformis TaxID=1665 RepID=UPI000B4088B8|nr:WXG100 family type VII secretion target [Arthrobacter globiformis]